MNQRNYKTGIFLVFIFSAAYCDINKFENQDYNSSCVGGLWFGFFDIFNDCHFYEGAINELNPIFDWKMVKGTRTRTKCGIINLF